MSPAVSAGGFWDIQNLINQAYKYGKQIDKLVVEVVVLKISDFVPNNRYLRGMLIFFFHLKKFAVESLKNFTEFTQIQHLRKSAWSKVKNVQRSWIGSSMLNSYQIGYLSIRSYPPSHFQVVARENEWKVRKFGLLMIWSKGRWVSLCPFANNSSDKKITVF